MWWIGLRLTGEINAYEELFWLSSKVEASSPSNRRRRHGVARTAVCRHVRANTLRAAETPRPCETSPRPRRSDAAGSAVQMSAAFVGSATLERERTVSTVSLSSARVEMPSGAGPAAHGRRLEHHGRLARGWRLEHDAAALRSL